MGPEVFRSFLGKHLLNTLRIKYFITFPKMLVRRSLLVFLIICVTMVLASNFNDDLDESERDSFNRVRKGERKQKLCGDVLFQMLYAVCMDPNLRNKRHAAPTEYPGHLSPFLMSVYRPSIDNDLIITDGGNWESIDSPTRHRFQKVNLLRRLNKRSAMPEQPTIGLATECCERACSYSQIRRYC